MIITCASVSQEMVTLTLHLFLVLVVGELCIHVFVVVVAVVDGSEMYYYCSDC